MYHADATSSIIISLTESKNLAWLQIGVTPETESSKIGIGNLI